MSVHQQQVAPFVAISMEIVEYQRHHSHVAERGETEAAVWAKRTLLRSLQPKTVQQR